MPFKETFPPVETAMELGPEELGPFILRDLAKRDSFKRYNYTLGSDPELMEYAGPHVKDFTRKLMEAWMWLEREGFVAPKPGQQDDWQFVTSRGQQVLEDEDFEAYAMGSLLPTESLDPVLARHVRGLFLRGDYETAIFRAFKEIEVRVRKKGKFSDTDIGVPLMRKAFKPGSGPLTDTTADKGEQQARADLYAGAIGTYKNPSSHRDVEYTDPKEVADVVHLANQLLRILDRI